MSSASGTPPAKPPVSEMSDSELGRVTRQSYQMKNPRRLRRANTRTGCIGSPDWTVQEQALLGTMPDGELAKKLGRTFVAVIVRRDRLRIPCFESRLRRWTPKEDALLGKMRDDTLARKL